MSRIKDSIWDRIENGEDITELEQNSKQED